jgi:hypothetical protein
VANARVMVVVHVSDAMVQRPADALADVVILVRAVRENGSDVIPDVCLAGPRQPTSP